MATFSNQAKLSATFANLAKLSPSETIYMVSEALDFYLVGSAEDETLVTQEIINWANQNKS